VSRAYNKMDCFCTDWEAEYGSINPDLPDPLTATHACPEMKSDGVQLTHNTMSKKQCLTRLKEKNPCTRECEVIKRLTLDAVGLK